MWSIAVSKKTVYIYVDNIFNDNNDSKTYIMIDDEVCMIKDDNKVKFYGKNEFCEAVEINSLK